jgi:hypothetical protein
MISSVDDYSIADIALFAYTHVAHEGGFRWILCQRSELARASERAIRIHSNARIKVKTRSLAGEMLRAAPPVRWLGVT